MYSRVVRDQAYQERLVTFLRDAYGLPVAAVQPAARGFFAETWQATTLAGERYFVKADHSPSHQGRFEASLPVVDHLIRHGIGFIPRPVWTAHGDLSCRMDGAVIAVFEWIDGANVETDETKPLEYALLAQVYAVPADGLALPVEDFAGASADDVHRLWRQLEWRSRDQGNEDDQSALGMLNRVREALAGRANRLQHVAGLCQPDRSGFRITHGDAGGNLLLDSSRYAIVDWDEAMYAPPERDAWVMCCRDRPNRQWAQDLFEGALRTGDVPYALRPERLAYYAYSQYFFYLAEILQAYLDTGNPGRVATYLAGADTWGDAWITECLRYADTLGGRAN